MNKQFISFVSVKKQLQNIGYNYNNLMQLKYKSIRKQ